MSPAIRLAGALLAGLLGCLAAGGAAAHEGHEHGISPVLDAQPAVPGLRVQIATTLGPQLLVENTGAQTLTVLGEDGRPFLRIGPAGVEADVRHPGWLDSYLPGGLPGRRAGGAPNWQRIKPEPAWGWFDTRLADGEQGERWRVPVLIGERRAELQGHFRSALQSGYWRAAWRTPPQLPPGVELMLVPGQPYGLMLSNNGARPVSVLDAASQPFLRIGGDGVALRPPGAREWTVVSRGRRHVWVDARTQPARPGARADASEDWQLVLEQDGRRWPLAGVSRWVLPAR